MCLNRKCLISETIQQWYWMECQFLQKDFDQSDSLKLDRIAVAATTNTTVQMSHPVLFPLSF